MLSTIIPAMINHLLAQEPWAKEKLAPHVGKVACMDTGVFVVKLKVAADGMLEAADADVAANVTIRIKLSDFAAILQNRERAASYVKIEGDADFAATLSEVGFSLRWEAEHDLQPFVGEVAAARIVSGAKTLFETAKNSQQKLAENLAEYFLEENPMLVRPQAVTDFTGDVTKMRDDVERLAKRIERLQQKLEA